MPGRRKPRKDTTLTDEAFSGAPGFLHAVNGPMPSKKMQLRAAKDEIKELKQALEGQVSAEEWGRNVPQELQDQYAVTALLASELHPLKALKRLGINESTSELANRIFGTPGVQTRLAELSGKFKANQEAILQTLDQIAIYGTGEDAKVRAITARQRMTAGWLDGEKSARQGNINAANFFMLSGGAQRRMDTAGELVEPADPEEVIDADSFLVHDVGEAQLVVDEDE